MSRLSKTIYLLVTIVTVALIVSDLFLYDPSYAQAGRQKSSDKQKKNPNASGDPEEQKKEEQRQIDRQVDESQGPASIAIDTNVVNVEAVVYNKKTGAVIQG